MADGGFALSDDPVGALADALRACREKAALRPRHGHGPRVLFANLRGGSFLLTFELMLAHRLRLDGSEVEFLSCRNLPICNNRSIDRPEPEFICEGCASTTQRLAGALDFPVRSIKDFRRPGQVQATHESLRHLSTRECFDFSHRGLPVGRLCEVSVSRHLCRDAIADDDFATETWRKYLASAITLIDAYEALLNETSYDLIVAPNGDFFWYNLLYAVAERRGVRVASYESGFLPGYCGSGGYWSFDNRYRVSRLRFADGWNAWRDEPLSDAENARLDAWIREQYRDSFYNPNPVDDPAAIREMLHLHPARPVVTLFSNVSWDGAAVDRRTVFFSMMEWVEQTVAHLAGTDVQVVIRPHPAEDMVMEGNRSRESVAGHLASKFDPLPANVRIVRNDDRVSSYELLRMSDAVVAYTSKIGLEALLHGVPAIIAGDAHFANRGFGRHPASVDEYLRWVESPADLSAPTKHEIEIARRYLYFFLNRTHLQLRFFETSRPFEISRLCISSLDELAEGRIPELDLIVDGLLNNRPILAPREADSLPVADAV
ncbi:MAG: hypothetical protein H6684_02075 [Deltaproteobacteria bacterium]|nr:hypothetical protein [Deltaproteobacteria bacterium]